LKRWYEFFIHYTSPALAGAGGEKTMKERINVSVRTLMICGMICAIALPLLITTAQGLAQGKAPQAQAQAPPAPTDKAAYFSYSDSQVAWKDLEARQVINHRAMEGGTFSFNIRIVKDDSPPLVHAKSVDLWIVETGTATAITGGELLDKKKNANPASDDVAGSSIRGGIEQPLKPGDAIFVPPGVPHGFKDLKGFRAYLIRWDVK
jgi:mannose-6-phosphate isomerase-like protein (cupin superfamily)